MVKIKQNLKATQDRQKIYADKNMPYRDFKVREHVLLKVKPMNVHNVFHVPLLKKNVHDPNDVIDWHVI
jgi:hypothetical protein